MRSGTKGPQVILSRRDPELIRALFELEVPEIADGLVEIRGVAREPGYRSKIAVESHMQGVDPVGACVGPRGSRVRMVVSELRGEKIDIIPWNTEPARFVAKALSPARVREVYIDDETREATVVVPNDQLALAIGKEGLNARLATRLTGWKIDIQSEQEFAQAEAELAFAGSEDGEEFSGRCAAVLSNGKRCPNTALPGSHYCGVPAHQALAASEPAEADASAEPEAEEDAPAETVDETPGAARGARAGRQRRGDRRARGRGGRGGCLSPRGSRLTPTWPTDARDRTDRSAPAEEPGAGSGASSSRVGEGEARAARRATARTHRPHRARRPHRRRPGRSRSSRASPSRTSRRPSASRCPS